MRLQVDEKRIEVAWWGAQSGALPVVLLHEGLGSVSMWRDFPEALAERSGRRVMAYSRFGHGRSDLPSVPHTVRFMHDEAGRLPAILDAAGIERAHLAGHSDGGSIALIFAAQYPERVESLLLEAPHVFVEDVSVTSIEQRTADYRRTDLRERLARHHRHVDVAFYGWSDVWLDPAFRTWNLEALLPAISCPLLLIQGEQDDYGTLRQIDAIEQQVRGPVERLVLPDCGHSPHRDQREPVLSAMTAFLRSRA
jgi:pimeloyl-ACP methyl ester carboxylesterase